MARMSGYLLIKTIHQLCAVATFALFVIRGVWMITQPERLRYRWVRVVPHVVDTLLFASAVVLVWLTHQYPGVETWLTVKIVALIVYIGLGLTAFRFAQILAVRVIAWVGAQLVFVYIVLVALTRSPTPFLTI